MNRPKIERPGITSRLSRIDGSEQLWPLPCGGALPFPAVLDVQSVDPLTGALEWRIEAHLMLIDGEPKMTAVQVRNPSGIDPDYMQIFFRWRTPLDVVQSLIPELVKCGIDPFEYDYPMKGYPDSANLTRHRLTRLTDDFLRDIAEQYRKIGRGYAASIAQEHGVSRRTVVSWVEKARQRGILGKTRPGKLGEQPED